MAVIFTPKQDFIRDTVARTAHAEIANNPLVHRTIAIALAEMMARGLGPNDLAGVNSFIMTWLNLSEEVVVPRPLPSKHLSSFGQPATIATEA